MQRRGGACLTIAAELGACIILVGDAFHLADNDPNWGYRLDIKFDFKNAPPPALPNQTHSLHGGWRWTKKGDKQTLPMDGHHASEAGRPSALGMDKTQFIRQHSSGHRLTQASGLER